MNKSAFGIFILYSITTILSILLNIGIQFLWIQIYSGSFAVEISMLIGVLVALPLKYFLEKNLIFFFKARNSIHDVKIFILYSIMGIFTTFIFLCVEYIFHLLFMTDQMRYIGGVVGLILGSFVKYLLDKHFVFKKIIGGS